MKAEDFKRINPNIIEIPMDYKAGMKVPARILTSPELYRTIDEKVIDQITNVACLPGIRKYAYCMPDGHAGYGFPIGGVAAFGVNDGIISPGGIGFDINCGMRLLRTNLTLDDIIPIKEKLIDRLYETIPSGMGSKNFIRLNRVELNSLMESGTDWCLERGYATPHDIEHIEDHGRITQADVSSVSDKAVSRGINQMGTLGSGNHYLEIEVARPEGIFNRQIAEVFGIDRDNQIIIAIHCGSRGLGHQIATDYLQVFDKCSKKYGLEVRDRELVSAPIDSSEGQQYFGAMACAANAAFVNRQLIVYGIRKVFREVFGIGEKDLGIETIYDVAHNIAKLETYVIDGREEQVLVHRKGATRSLGPGRQGIPAGYKSTGQPVIVGGSMESGSALLCGTNTADTETFGSSLHGAGRTMSRIKAKKSVRGDAVKERMARRGILVKTAYLPGLAEENIDAYKNIDAVIRAVDDLGISKMVARFQPILNIKG
nr:RtcB family protein [candidate division Zixibacteria bacterium]